MDLFENLSDNQIEAVKTIDEDLEIIACAGAGKTGVVSRRIINILKSNPDILPENIVAFTFTEKAAEELKSLHRKVGSTHIYNPQILLFHHFIYNLPFTMWWVSLRCPTSLPDGDISSNSLR